MKERFQNTIQNIKAWWGARSKRTRIVLIALVAIVAFLIIKGGNKNAGSVVEVVKRQTITRTVIASGKVVSSTDLSLGFETSDVVSLDNF